ncbi:DNase I-like protein [Hortaea werneckii]|nr:DNase I-like protein [Hortaea werneckii]
MADLNVYLTTFNCGRKPVNVDYFSHFLFDGLSKSNPLPPDLLVLSLQEIAPIAYGFLGGTLLTPYFTRFTQAVADAARNTFSSQNVSYHEPLVRNAGMTAIMVFAREEIWHRIQQVESAGVGVGLWEMGNKGAVGVRLSVRGAGENSTTPFTFVAAHLAPMEPEWERRNQDWRSICENLVFEPESPPNDTTSRLNASPETEPLLSKPGSSSSSSSNPSSLYHPNTNLFLLGDLNYRASDTAPNPSLPSPPIPWPQPVSSPADPHHYTHLLRQDQLSREKNAGKTLHNLVEAPINFPPTYKYSAAAQKEAARGVQSVEVRKADGRINRGVRIVSPGGQVGTEGGGGGGGEGGEGGGEGGEGGEYLWAPHRTPSWCDRILYTSPPPSHPVEPKTYVSLPVQPTSDHQPVVLSCAVPRGVAGTREEGGEEMEVPFSIRADWRERRRAARRLEVLVGMLAYLGLTWEGRLVVLGSVVGVVGGWWVLGALVG